MDAVSAVSRQPKIDGTQSTQAFAAIDGAFLARISGYLSAKSCDQTQNPIYAFVYETAKEVGVVEEKNDGTIIVGGRKFSKDERSSAQFMSALDASMHDFYSAKLNFFWITSIFDGGTSLYKPLLEELNDILEGKASIGSLVKNFKAEIHSIGKSLGGSAQKGLEALSRSLTEENMSGVPEEMIEMFMAIVLFMVIEMLEMIEKMDEMFDSVIKAACQGKDPRQDSQENTSR